MLSTYVNSSNKLVLRAEWEDYIKYGKVPSHVRPEILASWERSRKYNVNPFLEKNCRILYQSELSTRLKDNRSVLDVIRPYMNKIHQAVEGLGYMVFVTDNEAWVLYVVGDKEIIRDFQENLDFQLGVSWSEGVVGTTAVGVALAEQKPVPFIAEEKFCLVLKERACAAVPIKEADGRLVAVLGLATNLAKVKRIDGHVFGLLIAAQMAIENKLQLLRTEESLSIISSYYQTVFNEVSDAIVTVDSAGFIEKINSQAAELLSVDPNKVAGSPASDILNFEPVQLNKAVLNWLSKQGESAVRSGRARKIVWDAIPVCHTDGSTGGLVAIARGGVQDQIKMATAKNGFTFKDIIGNNREFKALKRTLYVAAQESVPVLLVGASGTGKELFAQAIHNASSRANEPFVVVNCGAVPRELIESEFFGYEEGAFTGARKGGHRGKFEQAHGGTIFLDEIGEMPWDLQVRLLRVLEAKKIVRIGGTESILIDVRIIAATNKNLSEEVRQGNFRPDLYWRLNVVTALIPPLVERPDDIMLLADYFLERYSQNRKMSYTLSDEAMNLFMSYGWPGNVRELRNVLERAVIFADEGLIRLEHLPEYLLSSVDKTEENNLFSLEYAEREAIVNAISESDGNLTEAAKLLGIARNTLYSKLDKYEIQCP